MSATIDTGIKPVLKIKDFGVDFWVEGTWYPAAIDMEYEVMPGEVLAIVGESGSGKSSSSMALLGLMPPNGRMHGRIEFAGKDISRATPSQLRRMRGEEMAVIFQEPMTALNPVYTIGFQIVEMLRVHKSLAPSAARDRAIELLQLVEMPNPEVSVDKYPHQLSGGQRQRAMIAMALACDPKLLIADEPTTALDVTVQAEILDLMRILREKVDAAIVLITHDMGVVADIADKIIVMKDGRIVEAGEIVSVFQEPQHPYTQQLLAAVPKLSLEPAQEHVPTPEERTDQPVLRFEEVVIEYPKRGRIPAFRAVENATFEIYPGEVVGLVGESGSGKSTIGRAAVGLLPVHSGILAVNGHNIAGMSAKELRTARRHIGIVFQDPGSSLNPRIPIGESIGEPIMLAGEAKGGALNKRIEKLLDDVELPRSFRNRYPHELSGGQRQRVGIARAIALRPPLLIADEPTSALDVSVQARFLTLLQNLQEELKFACLFITHDLAVIDVLAHRIIVMNRGKLVEQGTKDQVLRNPQDPYTQRLIAAVPVPDPILQRERREQRAQLLGKRGDAPTAEESAS
ncbi:peptide ABC transporter ATPase [Microbacterium mangrovi]|uniref:Peptide ABC transporter ATPase n=1 Tax=Microbacterium mangrovi TaxID=1348253 RepID=A0A0B2AA41_9MICO|nr:ABC transporter ATP-binding protein [Microbacterium mangrovi]KHK98432.1 peptide ABC transporter ATPase [Microbacterium mangrovi]